MPRILILTASFGEGHNTAANCIAAALREHPGTEVRVADVYLETVPRFTKVLQAGYGLAINKYPAVWSAIFNFLDKPGRLESTLPFAGNLREAVRRITEESKPDVIVSTYPLYAYLLKELRRRGHAPAEAPLFTIVTDSTAINSSWYRAGSESFVVADEETSSVLKHGGVEERFIKVLGFPVAPRLGSLRPLEPVIHGAKRLRYFPSSRVAHTLEVIAELRKIPSTEITVVTGRLKGVHEALASSNVADGVRVHLIGWTDKVPELLCSHHLYIGKAGGAIVHEAIAAQCPVLVSHVVPGQEEGNIELLERHDTGRLAAHYPAALAASVEEVFSNNAATWKRWKTNLAALAKPTASRDIAAAVIAAARK